MSNPAIYQAILIQSKLPIDMVGEILSFIKEKNIRWEITTGEDDFDNPFHIQVKTIKTNPTERDFNTFGEIPRKEPKKNYSWVIKDGELIKITSFFTDCYMCEDPFKPIKRSPKKFNYQYCYNCFKVWLKRLEEEGKRTGRRPRYFQNPTFPRGVCLIKL